MAPPRTNSGDSKYGQNSTPSLEEIIFSCGICQATVSDLYPSDADNAHSHSGDDDGMGTKLWIANCVHVFCGRHLDGGGVPFHSSSEPPQAICPVCVCTESNHEVRNLYGIRGVTEDKLDPAIPAAYARCPPVSLDGDDPGAEALRFQYSRMRSYSQEMTKRWRAADRKRHAVESTLHKERKQAQKLEAEHQELQKHNDEVVKKLQGWEGRKDQIRHYMGAVGQMASDIQTMRRELVKLGYHIEHKTYGLEAGPSPRRQPSVSHPVRGDSSTTLVHEQHRTSSSKRKRADYDPYPDDKDIEQELAQGNAHAMPPPQLSPLRTSQQTRLPSMNPPSTTALRPRLYRPQPRSLQRETRSLQPVQEQVNDSWRNNNCDSTLDQHLEDPVNAMHSMSLNDGRSTCQFSRRVPAPPITRSGAPDPQQQYSLRRAQPEHHVQPPQLRPAGLYLQTAYEQPQDYYDPSQAGDLDMDCDFTSPQTRHRQPLYPDQTQRHDNTAYSQIQALARPQAKPFSRLSNQRNIHTQSETPTQRRHAEQAAASVLSPFFKGHDASSRLDTMPPPSLCGPVARPMSRFVVPQTGRSMAPPRGLTNDVKSKVQYEAAQSRRRPNHTELVSHQRDSIAPHRNVYQPSGSQLDSQTPQRRPAAIVGTPARAGSQMGPYQPYRTGRMTLPPAPSSNRGWDPQVSQIRGVRGAGPSSSSQYGTQPLHASREPLFSQAGSRAIVRR